MSDTNEQDEVENPVPETNVLAIASHVVYGYVGNTMATFCMQTLGCDVAAINTVNFSNHTGYGQFTGPRTDAPTIKTLFAGLTNSHLTDFDVLLSGYIPSAAVLTEVTQIARDLRLSRETMTPGSFFWILDPVMGDQGRLYVSEELVRGYKDAISAGDIGGPDLLLPNSFELELLSGVCLSDPDPNSNSDDPSNGAPLTRHPTGDAYKATLPLVRTAIETLHKRHHIRMVIVTSVRIINRLNTLYVIGSEATSSGSPRIFTVEVPVLNCYFSGTGDMFAGLMVARLREACHAAGTLGNRGWASGDKVSAVELPLAKATVKVLSSMVAVLGKTMVKREEEVERFRAAAKGSVDAVGDGEGRDKALFLAETKAAEVRAVRNARDLISPVVRYEAKEL